MVILNATTKIVKKQGYLKTRSEYGLHHLWDTLTSIYCHTNSLLSNNGRYTICNKSITMLTYLFKSVILTMFVMSVLMKLIHLVTRPIASNSNDIN